MFFFLQDQLRDLFGPLNVFRYVSFRVIAATATALLITMVLYPWFIRRLKGQKIGQPIRDDGPETHQVKAGTPTMGGALAILAVLFSTLLWGNLSNILVWLVLFVMVGFAAVGFVDDFRKVADRNSKGLSGKVRLGLEFLIVGIALAIFFGFFREESNFDLHVAIPFLRWDVWGIFLPPAIYAVFASVLVVGTSNAVNLTDGLDGLAIGPVIVASATFLILAYLGDMQLGRFDISSYLLIPKVTGANELAVLCAGLIGAGIGFLWYNAHPALVFMGDTGALGFGGALGALAFFTKNELLAVIVFGVFLVEAISVITQRYSYKLTGKRVFLMAPIHHHFEKLGWPETPHRGALLDRLDHAGAHRARDAEVAVVEGGMAKATGNRRIRLQTQVATPFGPMDLWIVSVVVALLTISIVMIYSATIGPADAQFGRPSYYLVRQIAYVAVGFIALAIGAFLPFTVWRRLSYPLLLVSLGLLLLLPFVGTTYGNSTHWLNLGFVTIQPSELAKFAFVVYLARSIADKTEKMRSLSVGFLPHLSVLMAIILLSLIQPDLGTCIILAVLMVMMLFVAGTRLTYVLIVLFGGLPVVVAEIARSSARAARILAYLDPWSVRFKEGFQTVNALTSIGSGGPTGFGLGEGHQSTGGFLPEAESDFILPVIGEELGFIGIAAILLLFTVLIVRGVTIAYRTQSDFGRFLAIGLTMLIGLQAAINAAVAVALLPTKGLTLPFVSFGGSSLIISMLAAGVLLNLSRGAHAPVTPEDHELADLLPEGGAA